MRIYILALNVFIRFVFNQLLFLHFSILKPLAGGLVIGYGF